MATVSGLGFCCPAISKKPAQSRIWVRSGRNHHEVLWVVKLCVHSECHQADKEALAFDDQRHRRGDGIVSIATDDKIHLLNIQKAMIKISYEIWVGLIVEAHKLHRPAEELAVLVDVLLPGLVSQGFPSHSSPDPLKFRPACRHINGLSTPGSIAHRNFSYLARNPLRLSRSKQVSPTRAISPRRFAVPRAQHPKTGSEVANSDLRRTPSSSQEKVFS